MTSLCIHLSKLTHRLHVFHYLASVVFFSPFRNDSFHLNTLVSNSEDHEHQLALGQQHKKAITMDNMTYGPPQSRDILCRSKLLIKINNIRQLF